MPSIQITDQLGVNLDIQVAPASTLLKAVGTLPGMILKGASLQDLQILTLSDPAVQTLGPALTFQKPVQLGSGGPQLIIGAEAGVSFRVISRTADQTDLFDSDDYGDSPPIPAGACYVALGCHATVNAGPQATAGAVTFGLNAQSTAAIDFYRPFSLSPPTTLTEALRQTLGNLVIPANIVDLAALPEGVIVAVGGSGSLTLSATANLLAVANPLASLTLPSPLPSLAIAQTGTVTVGASWAITAEFQVRLQKIDSGRVRLGWYRKRDSEFTVNASATAGIDGGLLTGMLPNVIGAISSNAAADRDRLEKAGLSANQAGSIKAAVHACVSRKLELALSAELGSLKEDEAAFLYEIDLNALSDAGKDTVHAALTGNLSGLAGALPAGITEVHSILTRARTSRFKWKINLLGIFNAASVTELALSGTVTYSPSTGDLVIADTASASRFQMAAVNFGADEDKLRHVMAESFLITAAYRGSKTVVSPPKLTSTHAFFRLDNDTDRQDMRRYAAVAAALGVGPAALPDGVGDFGRCTVAAEVDYDDGLTRSLFLGPGGAPRDVSEYEAAGRQAIALLVLQDGDDAFRLGPATNDALWNRMKDVGPANFGQLFPQPQADGVRPDYLAIRWWADSMAGTAEILVKMNLLAGTAGAPPDDPKFQALRQSLASHLRDVAAKAQPLFGAPWGLVAMFLVSGKKAPAAVHITGPRFVFTAAPALAATT